MPRIVLLVVALLTAGLVAALRWSQMRAGDETLSGIVEAASIRVGSRVGGRIATVEVEEGEEVTAGQVLVTFEPYDLEEQRAALDAEVGRARAELERLEAGLRPEEVARARAERDLLAARLQRLVEGPRTQEVETGRERVRLSQAELDLARQEEERIRSLHESGVSTTDSLDHAVAALRVAEATLAVRRQELALLEEGTRAADIAAARAELAGGEAALALAEAGFREEEIAQARATLAAALASRARVDRSLDELVVRAPVAGMVEALDLEPGDLVPPNAPALSLLDSRHLWVRAYVPVNRMAVQVGDELSIRVDAFEGKVFRGRVDFVAREAEFTPGNVQTPEERSKQVFRVKVDLLEGLERLRPGMSVDVLLEPADGGS